MHLLHTLYPVALSSANIALGWFLYHLSESVVGGFVVAIGFLVVVAWLGRSIASHQSLLRTIPGES